MSRPVKRSNIEPISKLIEELDYTTNINNIDNVDTFLNKTKVFLNGEWLFITSNPIPVKAALKLIGFNCGRTRPPLMEINDEQKLQLETVLDAFFEKV